MAVIKIPLHTRNNNDYPQIAYADIEDGLVGQKVITKDILATGNISAGNVSSPGSISIGSCTFTQKTDFDGNKAGLSLSGDFKADRVWNAVWNDIVDNIPVPKDTSIEPGYAYTLYNGSYRKTFKRCQESIGIVSDTFGFSLGGVEEKHKDTESLMAISIGGYVLAHVDKEYKFGTSLTSGKNGILTKMNFFERCFHPERLLAVYWKPETEKKWKKVEVNGRSWVKIA